MSPQESRALQEQRFFHLTGKRTGSGLEALDGRALVPALFAPYRDLTRLRYDFPVVLASPSADEPYVHALSGLIDAIAAEVAPAGTPGERQRRTLLRLEREIRSLLAEGRAGTLSELWRAAADRLIERGGEAVEQDLTHARLALRVDGELADCASGLARRFVGHAWRTARDRKAGRLSRDIAALIGRLSDLVKADHLRSEAGRHADTLRAGVGSGHTDLFDFNVMAALLAKPSGRSALAPARRARIERVLTALRSQRLVGERATAQYEFDTVEAALAAFLERLPAMADLVKAMAIAELEVAGHYVEAQHDPYFADYGERSLGPAELALFPDLLVTLDGRHSDAAGRARLIEALSSNAPLKIVVETDDILDESTFAEGSFSLGTQLARSAMGLNDVTVLQTTSAELYRVRDRVLAAMSCTGPALVSVFGGAGLAGLPPYLVAAAATESRAFPTFSYDPAAGADWAHRFSLEGNPQSELDWPEHELTYADAQLQRTTVTLPFTFVDFVVADPRYAAHFARVAPAAADGTLAPAGAWLAAPTTDTVPSIWAVDDRNRAHRLIVDERLTHAARRCADTWRRLQELERLKRGPETVVVAAPAAEPAPASAPAAAAAPATAAAPAPAAAAPAAPAPAAEPASDEPYIETPRCTSCNECTLLNNRMFAYNENKQAYIKDPSAGTFRELVEAAESCQVAIIHPGKPRDPSEPGLEDLLQRAEAFR